MSLAAAKKWIELIDQDKELNKRLITLSVDDWDNYFKIVWEKGFTFSLEDLHAAWIEKSGIPGSNVYSSDQESLGTIASSPTPVSTARTTR